MARTKSTPAFSIPTRSAMGLLACIGLAAAQDMDIRGDGSNASIILQGKNINPAASDKIGVQGHSVPAAHWGIGVKGVGGYKGSYMLASTAGAGSRFGVHADGSNGTVSNYGVFGHAVGPAGSTNYGVYSSGNLGYTGSLINASDERLKKNIVPLKEGLAGILGLKPRKYEYRTEEFKQMNLAKGPRFGLLAQDVEEVFPDLVTEGIEANPEKSEDGRTPIQTRYKGVDYVSLIPVLVGAIQEQQALIETLNQKIARLER